MKMGRSKTSHGYFSMKHTTLYHHSQKIIAIQDDCDRKVQKCRQQALIEQKRKENILKLMHVFSEVFDKEFPEISSEIQATLFKEWEKQAFNKELAQANIQIIEKLKRMGNLDAIKCWDNLFKSFKMNER